MANTSVANFTLPSAQPSMLEGALNAQELAKLEQELAALQLRQGQYGPNMYGNIAVPNISPMIDAFSKTELEGRKKALQAKQLDLSGKYAEEQARQLRSYFSKRDGGQEVNLPGPTQDGGALTGRSPGDPHAFEEGMLSPYPAVAAAAKRDSDAYEKLREKMIDRSAGADVKASPFKMEGWGAKPEYKVEAGVGYNVTEGGPPTLAPGSGFTQEAGPNGTIINRNKLTGRVDVEGGGGVSQTLNMPGASSIQEAIKQLPEYDKEVQAAQKGIMSAQGALYDLQHGAHVGAGSGWEQTVKSFFQNRLGIASDSTTPTANLMRELANMTLAEAGGKLGAGFSDADREFMKVATDGGAAATPESVERMLGLRLAVSYQKMYDYNNKVEAIAKMGEAEKPGMGDGVRQMWLRRVPQLAANFYTREAAASFEAALTGQPFITRLEALQKDPTLVFKGFGQVAAPSATPRGGRGSGGTPADEEAARVERLRQLGFNPPGR